MTELLCQVGKYTFVKPDSIDYLPFTAGFLYKSKKTEDSEVNIRSTVIMYHPMLNIAFHEGKFARSINFDIDPTDTDNFFDEEQLKILIEECSMFYVNGESKDPLIVMPLGLTIIDNGSDILRYTQLGQMYSNALYSDYQTFWPSIIDQGLKQIFKKNTTFFTDTIIRVPLVAENINNPISSIDELFDFNKSETECLTESIKQELFKKDNVHEQFNLDESIN